MTAAEFLRRTEENPNWCSEITEPTEVIKFVAVGGSEISSLSPLLIFSGRDKIGSVARFIGCRKLKIAEGTFHGFVDFYSAGIEEIGNLKITQPNKYGEAAYFKNCPNLKIAQGKYPGAVDFNGSNVLIAQNLEIQQSNKDGRAADFTECYELTKIRGKFNGKVCGEEPTISEYHQYVAAKQAARVQRQEATLEI